MLSSLFQLYKMFAFDGNFLSADTNSQKCCFLSQDNQMRLLSHCSSLLIKMIPFTKCFLSFQKPSWIPYTKSIDIKESAHKKNACIAYTFWSWCRRIHGFAASFLFKLRHHFFCFLLSKSYSFCYKEQNWRNEMKRENFKQMLNIFECI